jgi:hypothetical protein
LCVVKDVEEAAITYFKVLSWYMSVGTNKKYEKGTQDSWPSD